MSIRRDLGSGLGFPQSGNMIRSSQGKLDTVTFCDTREPAAQWLPFPGTLPEGLAFGQPQSRIVALLGASISQFNPGFSPQEVFVTKDSAYHLTITYTLPDWTVKNSLDFIERNQE